jgi:hypothetical protein
MIIPFKIAGEMYSKKTGRARLRDDIPVHANVDTVGFIISSKEKEGGLGGVHSDAPNATVVRERRDCSLGPSLEDCDLSAREPEGGVVCILTYVDVEFTRYRGG